MPIILKDKNTNEIINISNFMCKKHKKPKKNASNSPLEKDVQKSIVSFLRSNGVLTIETDVMHGNSGAGSRFAFTTHHKNMGYTKGQPDLVLCLKNKVIFIEVKREKGTQSSEQKDVQNTIENNGFEYLIWRSKKDAENYFITSIIHNL